MQNFFQQIVSGLASGGIYASLALALVLIHRATGVINFAQGEMAMFSTYILWTLTTNHGWAYAPAFVATLLVSFGGGVGIHQLIIRPNAKGSVLRVVIVTIGLLLIFNGLATHDLVGRGARGAEPVPLDDDRHRWRRRSRCRISGRSRSRSARWRCSGRCSSSRRSASRCAPRRSTQPRRGSWGCGSRGCCRWAGGSRRCSARSPGCSPHRACSSTRT